MTRYQKIQMIMISLGINILKPDIVVIIYF